MGDLQVTFNNNDLIDLANDIAKLLRSESPGTIEYWIKDYIKRNKSVNFFPCDREEADRDDDLHRCQEVSESNPCGACPYTAITCKSSIHYGKVDFKF